MPQRRHRAVHLAEIGDGSAAVKFLGSDAVERREDRRLRIVDPHVDRPEFGLDALGRALQRRRVGDIGNDRQSPRAEVAQLVGGCLEPRGIARDDRDVAAARREFARRGAADTGADAGDNGAGAGDNGDRRSQGPGSAFQAGPTVLR